MAIIELKVDDKVLDKLLWLLGHFKPSEVSVIHNSVEYDNLKEEAESDYRNSLKEDAKTYSLKDIEKDLDDILTQYGA